MQRQPAPTAHLRLVQPEPVGSLRDREIVAEYLASEAGVDDRRLTELATELWRRGIHL